MWPFKSQQTKGVQLTLKISGLHCTSCVLNIDGALEDLQGVFSSQTNYAKAQTRVEFDPAVVSTQQLIDAVQEQGYRAELQT